MQGTGEGCLPVCMELRRESKKLGCCKSMAFASALPTRAVSACIAAAARTGSALAPATASSASIPPADKLAPQSGSDIEVSRAADINDYQKATECSTISRKEDTRR